MNFPTKMINFLSIVFAITSQSTEALNCKAKGMPGGSLDCSSK